MEVREVTQPRPITAWHAFYLDKTKKRKDSLAIVLATVGLTAVGVGFIFWKAPK